MTDPVAQPPEPAEPAEPSEPLEHPEAVAARSAVAAARPALPSQLQRLAAFADPTRLALLVAVHAAPGAHVKALAAATGSSANTTTQALASLLSAGAVRRVRDGRLSRWYLADEAAHALLHHLGAPHTGLHATHPLPPGPPTTVPPGGEDAGGG